MDLLPPKLKADRRSLRRNVSLKQDKTYRKAGGEILHTGSSGDCSEIFFLAKENKNKEDIIN